MKNKRFGLIRVEVFIDLDSLEKDDDAIKLETEIKYDKEILKENVSELVSKFTKNLEDYLNME